jgi:hypothetical protein
MVRGSFMGYLLTSDLLTAGTQRAGILLTVSGYAWAGFVSPLVLWSRRVIRAPAGWLDLLAAWVGDGGMARGDYPRPQVCAVPDPMPGSMLDRRQPDRAVDSKQWAQPRVATRASSPEHLPKPVVGWGWSAARSDPYTAEWICRPDRFARVTWRGPVRAMLPDSTLASHLAGRNSRITSNNAAECVASCGSGSTATSITHQDQDKVPTISMSVRCRTLGEFLSGCAR